MPSESLHRIVRAALAPHFPGADILHYHWESRWDGLLNLKGVVEGMMRQPAPPEVTKELGNLLGMLSHEIAIWKETGETIREQADKATSRLVRSLQRVFYLEEDWVSDIEKLGWSPSAVRMLRQKIRGIGQR